jgi:hypothetical protein
MYHVGVVCVSFRDGSPPKYFWWASETDPNEFDDYDREQVMAQAKNNGPFDTAAEAAEAARAKLTPLKQ